LEKRRDASSRAPKGSLAKITPLIGIVDSIPLNRVVKEMRGVEVDDLTVVVKRPHTDDPGPSRDGISSYRTTGVVSRCRSLAQSRLSFSVSSSRWLSVHQDPDVYGLHLPRRGPRRRLFYQGRGPAHPSDMGGAAGRTRGLERPGQEFLSSPLREASVDQAAAGVHQGSGQLLYSGLAGVSEPRAVGVDTSRGSGSQSVARPTEAEEAL